MFMGVVFRMAPLFVSTAIASILVASAAHAAPRQIELPSQPAAESIPKFARQAGLQILAPESLTRGVRTQAVRGVMEPRAGLDLLLAGTGLHVASEDGGVVTLAGPNGGRFPGGSESPGGRADATVEGVVVTGTALQNREAIRTRRDALTVVDALAQDDTGDLADQSLAEALSRLPAVSTMQVLYGEQESQYVAVRGITPDLNFVSVDGVGMISVANNGAAERRVDLALIPSQAARKTEVFKTFTADQDAGAIGGIINIVPYSAFERGRDRFYLDAYVNYVTNNEVPGWNSLGGYKDSPWSGGAKGLWTHRFGADEIFGVVLSGVYEQRSYDDVKRNPNGRTFYTATGGATTPDQPDWNGYDPAPQALVDYEFTSYIKTYGGSATLEFRPTPGWYSSLMLYDYTQTEDQTNNVFTLRGFANIKNQTQSTGTLSIPDVRTAFNYDRFENESRGAIFKTRYDLDEVSSLEFRAGYNANTFYDREYANVYQYKPTGLTVDYDTSGDSVDFALSGTGAWMDPSKYSLLTANDTLTRAKGEASEARLDYTRNFDAQSRGLGVKAGLGARKATYRRDLDQTVYATDKSSLAGYGYSDPNYTPWMWGYPVLWVDYAGFRHDVLPRLGINQAATASASLASDYRYEETISYGYVSALYALERTHVIAGLRFDMADYSADVPQSIGGAYQGPFARYKGDYRHLLPSLNLLQDVTDKLRLKAGFSRTLGRPAPEDIAQAELRNDTSFTISRGNPNLKPRVSDNLDLTLEYYFNGAKGLASVGVFSKTIKDDIYALKEDQLIDGIHYTISTPMNANKSKMRGIEAQYINNALPGLPGVLKDKVGVAANVTRIWGDMDYLVDGVAQHVNRLMFQRDWMFNVAVFYKLPRDGEARIGYNWGDKYYDGIGAVPWLNRGPEARGQLDATIRYRLAHDWIVKLQAKNLLNEDLYLGYGQNLSERRAEMKKGQSFFLNLIYRP